MPSGSVAAFPESALATDNIISITIPKTISKFFFMANPPFPFCRFIHINDSLPTFLPANQIFSFFFAKKALFCRNSRKIFPLVKHSRWKIRLKCCTMKAPVIVRGREAVGVWKRLMSVLLVVLLCCPIFAVRAEEITANGRVNRALLVGCDRFLTQTDTTPSSRNNVLRMVDALSGGTLNMQTLVTREEGLSSASALVALIRETFGDADADDVSYFYISTHGLWNTAVNGLMTLLLSDGESEEGITAYELRRVFDTIPGKKVLLLDACHSGAMIGKGVEKSFENLFAGDNYYVVCSSGGEEESWYWSGEVGGERLAGAGYFSGALADALSRTGSFGADENRDGVITLTELRRRLLQSHGASTVRTYPEDSDFALFSYDLSAVSSRRRETSIEGITFSGDTLSADAPVIDFSFNVVRTVQVAYQLVYRRQGIWDFDQSTLIYDNNGDFGSYAIAGRTLSPGLKERSITLNTADAQSSGYVLLQILVIEKGLPSVVWSKVLCVPPTTSDPELRVHVQDAFCPESGEELTFVVYHGVPCELTVTIEDEAGQTVRRLSSRQASRPEQLSAPGSTFCWNGTDSQGKLVNAGLYRVRVKAYVGTERYEVESGWISLTEMVG